MVKRRHVDLPVVRSIAECQSWCYDIINRSGGKRAAEDIANKINGLRFSTSFSGVGAPDVAVDVLKHAAQEWLGLEPEHRVKYDCIFAVERDFVCQYELQLLPEPPQHIFGDITDFVNESFATIFIKHLDRWSYDELVHFARTPNCVSRHASCVCHPTCRACRIETADLHIAGTPCVDFSSFNNDPRGVQGPTMYVYIIWVALRTILNEPFVLHEIVPGKNGSSIRPLEKLLADRYIIATVVFDAYKCGHPCHRERRLTWMTHKSKVVVEPSTPWPSYPEQFYRDLSEQCTYHIYMLASDELLRDDLAWCSSRDRGEHKVDCPEQFPEAMINEWFKALPFSEQERLIGYYNIFMDKMADTIACGLGQKPDTKPWHNSGKNVLMCLVKNSHIVYDFKHMRWLHPLEMILAQSFPVLGCGQEGASCSFSKPRPKRFPPRRRTAMVNQAGNSMNVHAIAIALLWLFRKFNVHTRCQSTAPSQSSAQTLLESGRAWFR